MPEIRCLKSWSLVLLSLFLYYVSLRIKTYLEYNVVVAENFSYDRLVRYPSLTLCPVPRSDQPENLSSPKTKLVILEHATNDS